MEVTSPSETWVDFQWTTQCYIPGGKTLHNHCCENLKSFITALLFQQLPSLCGFIITVMSCVIHSWQVISPVFSVTFNISCNGDFPKLSPCNTVWYCMVPSSKACHFLSEISFVQTQILPYLYPAESMFWIQVMLVPTCNAQSDFKNRFSEYQHGQGNCFTWHPPVHMMPFS
jgi:hypothetical protein